LTTSALLYYCLPGISKGANDRRSSDDYHTTRPLSDSLPEHALRRDLWEIKPTAAVYCFDALARSSSGDELDRGAGELGLFSSRRRLVLPNPFRKTLQTKRGDGSVKYVDKDGELKEMFSQEPSPRPCCPPVESVSIETLAAIGPLSFNSALSVAVRHKGTDGTH
jgi:hypothetical protein